jgi:sulfur carrier protein
MNLTVNGEACILPDGATVGVLAELHGVGQRGTAVAVDGVVVPRRQWDHYVLVDGQTLELVRAVQGG